MGAIGLSVFQALRRMALEHSTRVYLVGGPVRDVLLAGQVKDLDFGVEGFAPAVAQRLGDELGGKVVSHKRFLTATVHFHHLQVDLVTARSEVYPRAGSLPQVTPDSTYADLARRDFSVNALALPLWEREPEVVDPVGGLADLKEGLIRALHPLSFRDDPTRLLRAIRYQKRFGFRLEPETLGWMNQSLAEGSLGQVSGDRIRHELERIFQEDRALPMLQHSANLGILEAVHPQWHSRYLSEGVMAKAQERKGDQRHPLMYLAWLVYHFTPENGEELAWRLNLPREWRQVVRSSIELGALAETLSQRELLPSQVHRLLEPLALPAIGAAIIVSEGLAAERLRWFQETNHADAPSLTGGDLVAMGVPAGPRVGQLLRQLQDARLDGETTTPEEERRWMERRISESG